MINCPKCGFQQPPDDFCASCGVNMSTYRPAKKPFFVALRESRFAQAIALTLVIAVGLLYLKSKIFLHEEQATFSTLEEEEKSAPNFNLPRIQHPQSHLEAVKGNAPPQQKVATLPLGDSKVINAPIPVPEAMSAQVIFLEVPKAVFEKELAPYINFQGSNNIRGGSLSKFPEQTVKESRDLGTQNKVIQKKEIWDLIKRNPATPQDPQEYGFSLQIENTDNAENLRTLQFSYLSHLPLYTDRKIASVETSELMDSVKVPVSGGFFIVGGGFPRRTGSETYPLNGGVFDILNSPRFKEGETEFVILVMPKP
ncbi:MAG: hypothetical protein A4S09_11525 [Proteobacteria bacterium SG_bin7]|nr:MAG: hypothetical protein A4S09_11525 [Proteobacteria bacterium SG_bin7]